MTQGYKITENKGNGKREKAHGFFCYQLLPFCWCDKHCKEVLIVVFL